MFGWILGAVVAVLLGGALVWLVVVYNRLVGLRNRFKGAFAQIDVQLKRRHDLIPNVVEAAKGHMRHERATLEGVTRARSAAVAAREAAAERPDDGTSMRDLGACEGRLAGALSGFFALSENYPDLRASESMRDVMEELKSSENKVAFARQAFNDAVMRYNSAREQMPTALIAGALGFGAAGYFEISEALEKEAPEISL